MRSRIMPTTLIIPVILGFLFANVVSAAPRLEEVYNAKIEIPSGKAGSVAKAVKKAAFNRQWQVQEKGGAWILTYEKTSRKSTVRAVVKVTVSGNAIHITRQSTEGLSYDAGSKSIHRRYNGWVKNLEREIRATLGAY